MNKDMSEIEKRYWKEKEEARKGLKICAIAIPVCYIVAAIGATILNPWIFGVGLFLALVFSLSGLIYLCES